MKTPQFLSSVEVGNLLGEGVIWDGQRGLCWWTDIESSQLFSYRPADQHLQHWPTPDRLGCFADGSCVDSEGYVWNAQWGGSQLVRYSPEGKVDLVLPLPVSQLTCVAFGGEQLDLLFVTSARQGLQDSELAHQPEAGNLLVYQTQTTGIADPVFEGLTK